MHVCPGKQPKQSRRFTDREVFKKDEESKDVGRMLRICRKTITLQRIRKPGLHGISIKNIFVISRRGVGFTSGPEAVASAKDRSFGVRFPLTYEVVISKQHSAVFTNQAFSFSPRGKEDLKWSMITRKPRYSEQMESGVLYFVAQGGPHGKRYGFASGIGQSR